MFKPLYSGVYYEKEYVPFLTQIHKCYTHRLGPGELSGRRKDTERLYAVVVPHSSYALAGPGMAWGYKLLSEHYFPETYVLLLPGIQEKTCIIDEAFESSFGVCSVDTDFAQKLVDTGLVSCAEHVEDIALELQIPFLQQASRDRISLLKVLPLFVSSSSLQKIAEELVRIKKDIVVILASDFVGGSSQGDFSGHDKQLIHSLLRFDADGFERYLEKHDLSLPSKDVFLLGIEILKQLGVSQGEVVNYYTAAEMGSQEAKSFVSVVF